MFFFLPVFLRLVPPSERVAKGENRSGSVRRWTSPHDRPTNGKTTKKTKRDDSKSEKIQQFFQSGVFFMDGVRGGPLK